MKTAIFTVFLLTLAVCAISLPIDQVDEPDVLPEEPEVLPQEPEVLPQEPVKKHEDDDSHLRVKRFTCDVLGAEAFGVKLNDAACGLHCLTLGKRGGWCDRHRVCNCRK